jgi:hypothetical protein
VLRWLLDQDDDDDGYDTTVPYISDVARASLFVRLINALWFTLTQYRITNTKAISLILLMFDYCNSSL